MIEAKTGIDPVDPLEAIDETLGSQSVRTEPATQIQKPPSNGQNNNGNAR